MKPAPYAIRSAVSLIASSANALRGRAVSNVAPVAGQVLGWTGSEWEPSTVLVSTGDITAVSAGNGLTGGGTSGAVTLSAEFAGSGSSVTVARSDHNHDGTYVNAGEAAGGDLSGSYPNPGVAKLQGRGVASTAPSSGQVLKWTGSQWAPGADESGGSGSNWGLSGNAGTNAGTNYLGTSDDQPLVVKTNGTEALRVDERGFVGVDWMTPTEELTLNGSELIIAEKVFHRGVKGYTGTSPTSVFVAGNFAYVVSWGEEQGLKIYDITDPGNILLKGSTSTNLDNPSAVFVSGRYAYVTSYSNNRLAIFDVADPSNIVTKAYTTAGLNGPCSAYVSGRYAYVASHDKSPLKKGR